MAQVKEAEKRQEQFATMTPMQREIQENLDETERVLAELDKEEEMEKEKERHKRIKIKASTEDGTAESQRKNKHGARRNP